MRNYIIKIGNLWVSGCYPNIRQVSIDAEESKAKHFSAKEMGDSVKYLEDNKIPHEIFSLDITVAPYTNK